MLQIKCDVCGKAYEPIHSLGNVPGDKFGVCFVTSTVANEDNPDWRVHKEIDLCPKCAKMLLALCGIDVPNTYLPLGLAQFFRSADEKEE